MAGKMPSHGLRWATAGIDPVVPVASVRFRASFICGFWRSATAIKGQATMSAR